MKNWPIFIRERPSVFLVAPALADTPGVRGAAWLWPEENV
jgi:hypothetical protein